MERKLMTGNEAIARAFWEAGGRVVSAYPGTPSTEITENAATYEELYAEWAPNEKVALEVAIGSAIAGARSLAAMKHVGLNVAADPLFTAAYTGTNAGLLIITADDPGMHSSQNEQDNRHYGMAAKLPVLEPANSAEAHHMTKLGLELSETYDTPVLLRLTTRIAHGQTAVCLNEREEVALKPYQKNIAKYVMTPAGARPRHIEVEKHIEQLIAYAETAEINREEMRDSQIGVVCSGAVYQYVREALPNASIFKLGMAWPLPKERLSAFAAKVDKLYVVEELDPIYENALKSWGIACQGKEKFSLMGEIFPEHIKEAILGEAMPKIEQGNLPMRPPVLCAGCPHRATFAQLKKLKVPVSGDIGCYTLAASPPLSALDTTVCMGASISMAHGMNKAFGDEDNLKPVAVLGESTFLHSGLTGLVNACYNEANITIMLLDNAITAMTGHQQNPASGRNAKLNQAPSVDFTALAKACGVEFVKTVDPFEQDELAKVIKEAQAFEGVAVVICQYPCVLLPQFKKSAPCRVVTEKCIGCKGCLRIGCPAIRVVDQKAIIDDSQCTGCNLCTWHCPTKAIAKGGN